MDNTQIKEISSKVNFQKIQKIIQPLLESVSKS